MGLARKDALKRMNGLKRRIEEHIQKLARYPDSQENAHWRGELRSWIKQVEAASEYVGRKTQQEWQEIIESWKASLGDGNGPEEEA
jgi:hypothetical protein